MLAGWKIGLHKSNATMTENFTTTIFAINLLLLAVASCAAWVLSQRPLGLQKVKEGIGFKLLIAGLAIFAIFYIAEIGFNYILPVFMEPDKVAAIMKYPGLVVGSLAKLLVIIWIMTGCILTVKAAISLISELEESKKALTQELADQKTEAMRLRDVTRGAVMATQAKSELLANVSHELRTPLNAIIGFSEILEKQLMGTIDNPKYRDYISDIGVAGRHLLALINDILDYSKLESGEMELQEDTLDVSELIHSSFVLVKNTAEEANVNITMDIADNLPNIYADERRLRQIMLNLLSNSIKFTPPGGEITVKAWCSPNAGHVIQVSDTGIGIAPENIPKALAPFGQIDNRLSREYQGTGLGLPLSKFLTEMHSGSLNVESELGVGTTITIRLPSSRVFPWDTVKARA